MNSDLTPEQIARLPIASRLRYREETILLHVARSGAGDFYTARTTADCLTAPRAFHPTPDDAVEEAARYVDALRG